MVKQAKNMFKGMSKEAEGIQDTLNEWIDAAQAEEIEENTTNNSHEHESSTHHPERNAVTLSKENVERPTVLDFQQIQQNLTRLEELVPIWLAAHDWRGLFIRTNTQDLTVTLLPCWCVGCKFVPVVLGDKRHAKHFLSVVKQVHHQVYLLTPKWMRELVWQTHDDHRHDAEGRDADDNLEGIGSLGYEEAEEKLERCGHVGQDVTGDRTLVNGMEGLTALVKEEEERVNNDNAIEEAMECFNLFAEED